MDNNINKRHAQLPNGMSGGGCSPKDQFIYLVIKMCDGDGGCYPSLETISRKSGYSVPVVRECIRNLISAGYISMEHIGKKNYYYFNVCDGFEVFSPEFIECDDLSPLAKSNIVAIQQHMFKGVRGYGKVSYSNRELAKLINTNESNIRKSYRELERKGYLTLSPNLSRDPETGCKLTTKIFHLGELGQSVIWALRSHEERLNKVDKDVDELKKENQEMRKMLDALMRERDVEPEKYIM